LFCNLDADFLDRTWKTQIATDRLNRMIVPATGNGMWIASVNKVKSEFKRRIYE